MKCLYIFLCLFFLCSCFDSEQRDIVNLTKEWSGRKLVFPKEMVLNAYWKDSVISYNRVDIRQYAILTYIDSIGCMSCKMNLPGWAEFILKLDSISNKTVPCLFILNPKNADKERIVKLLQRIHFSYPVCIDRRDSFNLLNNFPKDDRFQTFLLDKDNKVLAIGNPIHNPHIKELYLKIIQGEQIEEKDKSKQIKTKVDVDKTSVSMGNFDWQEEQKAFFTLKNTGDNLLVIQDITTSCGCTTVAYSREPVQPGGEVTLEVAYKAEQPEYFKKTITVHCNAKPSPVKLTITGNAE